MIGHFAGMKVFEDKNAYETKIRVIGLPDKRKPNNQRPLFRRKKITTPLIYFVKGVGVLAHPSVIGKIQNLAEEAFKASQNML